MDYSPGLRGVVAGETAISTVGKEGTSLRYRGYDATELTSNNTYAVSYTHLTLPTSHLV